eukprot:TRINITY_DN460_c1_g1_i1.p2 TRINITY_DN460_c1_g1~~TRINITY_DN460_c1_g1_i1.p2  ORF type:complete len:51 (-),score=3.99 TRINITY_DN460_c1_g1_i1:58-210(-)
MFSGIYAKNTTFIQVGTFLVQVVSNVTKLYTKRGLVEWLIIFSRTCGIAF